MSGQQRPTTSNRRRAALELLSQGLSQPAVAERLGCSVRTVRRYVGNEKTQAELRALQDERLGQLTRRALTASDAAFATLLEVAGDPEAPSSARVAAARSVVDLAFKSLELHDLTQQVADLREAVNRIKESRHV